MSGKNIYVCGYGEMFNLLFPLFKEECFNLLAFVDTRENCNIFEHKGKPVISPKFIDSTSCDFIFIFCKAAKNIAKSLARDWKLPPEKILPLDILDENMKHLKKPNDIHFNQILETVKNILAPYEGLFECLDQNALARNTQALLYFAEQYHAQHAKPIHKKTRTCEYLWTALNFEPDSIFPCCENRTDCPPFYWFDGGKLDLEKYRTRINEIINELQCDTHLCEGCPLLVETDETLEELYVKQFSFKFLIFNHFRYFCNCKCNYCNHWKTPQKYIYSVFDIIKHLKNDNFIEDKCQVHWGGGEPTIYKEFDEMIFWFAKNKFTQTIFTNAIKTSSSVISLLQEGKITVCTSPDSASPTIFKKMKGVDAFDKVIKTCRAYTKADTENNFSMKYIITDCNNNANEIKRFLDICAAMGVKNVVYSLDIYGYKFKDKQETFIENAAFFVNYAKKLNLNISTNHVWEPYLTLINEHQKSM